MDEHQLLTVLLEETKCGDCALAHASGGPSNCAFESRTIPVGEQLYAQADKADCVWFIKSGAVTMTRGSETVASLALRDHLIGVDCLVSPVRLSDAVAATEVQACTMSKNALLSWLGNDQKRVKIIIDAAMNDPNVVQIIDKMS